MKSEKEKMLAGELYRASDPELSASYFRAQRLTRHYNKLAADDVAGRRAALEELFSSVGERTVVSAGLRCDYGWNLSVGRDTFINYNCVLLDCNRIVIGDEVQIGPGVHIYTASHPVNAATRRSGLEYALPVYVGDGVWLGGGAIVCPGVRIGENTVVGAGSVVVRDLPANVVCVGNPCRAVRSRSGLSDVR